MLLYNCSPASQVDIEDITKITAYLRNLFGLLENPKSAYQKT